MGGSCSARCVCKQWMRSHEKPSGAKRKGLHTVHRMPSPGQTLVIHTPSLRANTSFTVCLWLVLPIYLLCSLPQWGAADAEIKVSSGGNTELKRSPFKAWSRSVYSHTCYAYCQGFLPCLFLPFRSIHLHIFQKSPPSFPVLAVANTWFLCRPAE